MTPSEGEFVDRMGLFMEKLGGSRTMGRVYGWLMICAPSDQSLTELATTLGVSKASISTTARQLEEAGMVERFPTSDRQHRYRIAPGGWTHVLEVQLAGMSMGLETLDFGLSVIGRNRPEQRARLEETREFFAFCAYDASSILERWKEYRAKKAKKQKRSSR